MYVIRSISVVRNLKTAASDYGSVLYSFIFEIHQKGISKFYSMVWLATWEMVDVYY